MFTKMSPPFESFVLHQKLGEMSPSSGLDTGVLHGRNVLVAEDSPENQFLVKRLLRKLGATVEIANDGREAMQKARGAHYDFILMDIQMPSVDGYEATRALRSAGYLEPIIAMTAHTMPTDPGKTKAAGFDYHLTKPFTKDELLNMLEVILKSP